MSFLNRFFRKSAKPPSNNPSQQGKEIDLTRVFPRVKAIFNDKTPGPNPDAGGETPTLSKALSPVYEPFAERLGIFYAVDMGNSYSLVQNKHLSDGLTLQRIRNAAISNMKREINGRTEIKRVPANMMMLINGGNFEAAMMLLDELWEKLESVLKDQVCIAIPAPDLLFIAGKNDPVGREGLRSMIRQFFDEPQAQGLLVQCIYAREKKQWVVIEKA